MASNRGRPGQWLLKSSQKQDDANAPWVPGFHATLRLLLVVRVASAMYTGISDCDETFNYWEPLYLISQSTGPDGRWQAPFQTWEYAPEYAIRSWAYLAQYLPVTRLLPQFFDREKAATFYVVRIFLGFSSAVCEASLVQASAQAIHPKVAWYLIGLLMTSAGLYESATALLPSTFAMYTTTMAMSYALFPSREGAISFPSNKMLPEASRHRTLLATSIFALGALLAWPFALVLSFPFVFEELFLASGLLISSKRRLDLVAHRTSAWLLKVGIAACIAMPIVLIDSLAYGRTVVVPLNIIVYNILSAKRGAGPTLYGTEPWYYYLLNLTLNFGPALYVALASLPIVLLRAQITREKNTNRRKEAKDHDEAELESSGINLLLTMRMLPAYIWLGLLTVQPHKEERFIFAAYPLICLNGAIALFCIEDVGKVVGSSLGARASKIAAKTARILPLAVIAITGVFSLSRVVHLRQSYHAPFTLLEHFAEHEYPVAQKGLTSSSSNRTVRLCYGKEWHRYPGTFLVPARVKVDFIQSEFRGILPKHFIDPHNHESLLLEDGVASPSSSLIETLSGHLWPWKASTRAKRKGFNDLNREEPDRYVDLTHCDYLIDVDFPHAFADRSISPPPREPRYVRDTMRWTHVHCLPFLDAPASRASPDASLGAKLLATLERTIWLPPAFRAGTNRYGDYCLLRSKAR